MSAEVVTALEASEEHVEQIRRSASPHDHVRALALLLDGATSRPRRHSLDATVCSRLVAVAGAQPPGPRLGVLARRLPMDLAWEVASTITTITRGPSIQL